MRIMTYNIRIGIQQGIEPIARIIRNSNADIVALQEVGKNWTYGPPGDTLAKISARTQLPHFAYAPALTLPGQGISDDPDTHKSSENPLDAQYGHGLLSRWPITQTNLVPLTRTLDEQRVLLFSTIQTNHGPLQILSTHLSHLESDRPTHAQELLAAAQNLANSPNPALILGDLNESPEIPWIQTLQKSWRDADQQHARLTFPATLPNIRIDYLFALNAQWQSPATILDEPHASDHRPVIAQLLL